MVMLWDLGRGLGEADSPLPNVLAAVDVAELLHLVPTLQQLSLSLSSEKVFHINMKSVRCH
jgi:hypothetical protein